MQMKRGKEANLKPPKKPNAGKSIAAQNKSGKSAMMPKGMKGRRSY